MRLFTRLVRILPQKLLHLPCIVPTWPPSQRGSDVHSNAPYLEAEVHGHEGHVIPGHCLVLGEEVEVVLELEQSEVDQTKQVRPDVDRFVGENKSTVCIIKNKRTVK